MEIRIGVRNVAREVAFESTSTPEEVRATIAEAFSSGAQLVELQDEKGGTVLVPTDALGYVEIGSADKPRVGFGTSH